MKQSFLSPIKLNILTYKKFEINNLLSKKIQQSTVKMFIASKIFIMLSLLKNKNETFHATYKVGKKSLIHFKIQSKKEKKSVRVSTKIFLIIESFLFIYLFKQ